MAVLVNVIIASLIVSLASFLGAVVLFSKRLNEVRIGRYFVGFAAGSMLTVAFLDLLPEAVLGAGETVIFPYVFLGIVSFFFLERFIIWFHHHDSSHGVQPRAVLILVGDGIHNFIDGVAMAAAFLTSPVLGVFTTMAIALHEIPQEIADLSVLVTSGLGRLRALVFNFFSGLAAVLGALLSFYFLAGIEELVPVLLAFTAGMFIYISCSDLVPEMHHEFARERKWSQSVPFILGVVTLVLLGRVLSV